VGTNAEERKRRILVLIIQTYIEQTTPVSSQTISERLGMEVSPATVRNVMGELEVEELIAQPHTSAGRVPTDLGYRYYVDSLMEVPTLLPAEIERIETLFVSSYHAMSVLVERAARVLATLSQQVAVGLAPALRQEALKRFEVIPLEQGKLLGVVRTTDGFVHSHVVELQEELQGEELAGLLRFINAEFAGVELGGIETLLTHRLLAAQDAFFYLVRRAQQLLQHAVAEIAEERLHYEGLGNLFIQPEFREDVEQTRALVQTFEEPALLLRLLDVQLADSGLRVTIGREHATTALAGCSVVSASYGCGGHVLGRIGIIGPTRMPYPRVAALVGYMGQQMSDYLTHALRE